MNDLDRLAVNTLRFLAVDMVEKANSGHPGAPMGQAAMAYLLWTRILRHDPADPQWIDRDRFVLSCGHASALLYSLLHLAGYDLPMEELKRFRQLGSRTPGHPEVHLTPGVETTTGPLGQGLVNAVGMAVARAQLADRFNRDGFPLFSHRIWVFASDGDLMEGVSSEGSSLAGHLGLGTLNVLWDDNRISIDGPTDLAFTEDVEGRYAAYGWHVQRVDDGNDLEALEAAMRAAAAEERPSLIAVRTHIGFGSPNKQDTSGVHGSPLGTEETLAAKRNMGFPTEPTFHVTDEARRPYLDAAGDGARAREAWTRLLERYAEAHPELAAELRRRSVGELPEGWEDHLPAFSSDGGPLATRSASGKVLNAVAPVLPELTGGSADLTPSNNTFLADRPSFSTAEPGGPNLRFGVREHAMGSILNGMALSGLVIPYGGTFLTFSDYMRPAIRLAALMELGPVYVFTHDSVFLGEDGPTHQPVEHLAALRAIPGLTVFRPADAIETREAWRWALSHRDRPTALALTRQKLPILGDNEERAREGIPRGGYVVADPTDGEPEAILVATGSEVSLALAAARLLGDEGRRVRVVSLASWDLFAAQDEAWRRSVLPPAIGRRLAIEAGVTQGWDRWVGDSGSILGIDRFGASAPFRDLAEAFGFTPEAVASRVRDMW